MSEIAASALPARMLSRALDSSAPLVDRHVRRIRKSHPDADPTEVIQRLNNEFRAATVTSGAGVGASAAAPGVGTTAAVALSGAEMLTFLQASALYVLSRAAVQGISLDDIERRRTLVLTVMLGESANKSLGKVAERTGQHWANQIVRGIPYSQILKINKILGRNFVTKYGTRQGIIVLGRAVPLGVGAIIGGTANAVLAQGIVRSANHAFGPPPPAWPAGSADKDDRTTPSRTVERNPNW